MLGLFVNLFGRQKQDRTLDRLYKQFRVSEVAKPIRKEVNKEAKRCVK